MEIHKGEEDIARDAQWWIAIDGMAEYHVETFSNATEQDVRNFLEADSRPPGGFNLNILSYFRRTVTRG